VKFSFQSTNGTKIKKSGDYAKKMKKSMIKMVMVVAVIAAYSSCTTLNHSTSDPNARVNLNKSDFELSEHLTAKASSTKILFIDFARLFTKKTGEIEGKVAALNFTSVPVIGNLVADKTANYSLYNLMNENPGYDVVFYPQYETKVIKPILGIGFIVKTTTVKTTARLGKLNK
jgi:hypothetical protein